MSELIATNPVNSTDLQRTLGIKPESPQASRLSETSSDVSLGNYRTNVTN